MTITRKHLSTIIKKVPTTNPHIQHLIITTLNSEFIYVTKAANSNLPSLSNNPNNLITQIIKAINCTTKLIHKINKKENLRNLKHKINKILTHKELSTKIIYKIIKNKTKNEHVNFIIKEENNDIKIEINTEKISDFVHNKYNNAFSASTSLKPLSFWLNHIPTLTTNNYSLPDTSTENIKFILTNRANTAPGIDTIQFDMFKFLAYHNSSIFKILNNLFHKIIILNHIPISWKKGTTTLIPKNDNSHNS